MKTPKPTSKGRPKLVPLGDMVSEPTLGHWHMFMGNRWPSGESVWAEWRIAYNPKERRMYTYCESE